MHAELSLHLRDIGEPLVKAWRREFAGVDRVTISCGDIFLDGSGPVGPNAPIDMKADAIVSPANSFGFMDGGIDALYTHQFGPGLQERLQRELADHHDGELPVGQAVIVATGHADIPWCISAPTMRIPQDVADTVNAFLALRAALQSVIEHNRSEKPSIRTVLCPGLATSVGRMPVDRCARQMRAAWDSVCGEGLPFPSTLHQAARDEDWLLR